MNDTVGVTGSQIEGIVGGFKSDVLPSIANVADRQSLTELSDRLLDGFI